MARPSPQTDRVVALIELLSSRADQELTLAEATRRLSVNKSTCHSMLTALTTSGWLLRDPYRKTYRLGPAFVAIGVVAADGFPALAFARSAMAELSVEHGLHCTAFSGGDDSVTVLDHVRDVRAVGTPMNVGAVIPLRPPLGAIVLAWATDEVIERWLGHAPADRRTEYRHALDAVRARGYGVEASPTPSDELREMARQLEASALLDRLIDELSHRDDDYIVTDLEFDGARSIAAINAPVFDHDSCVALVLSLTGFTTQLSADEIDKIGRRLIDTTTAVTAAARGERRGPTAREGTTT